jgi:undecaprenyl-diphosphatase
MYGHITTIAFKIAQFTGLYTFCFAGVPMAVILERYLTPWLPFRNGPQLSEKRNRTLCLAACAIFATTAVAVELDLHRFDYAILHSINSLARRSSLFDYAVRSLERDMFSNLLLVTLVWYVWFKRQEVEARAGILVGVLAAFASGIVSRGLQLALPMHLRPLHDPALHFKVPLFVDPQSLNHWSSFPSDHAAVLFGLSMVMFLTDRRVGWVAMACATVLNVGRMYLGFHYPSDILAGAMLGILMVSATYGLRHSKQITRILVASTEHQAIFYAACFYIMFGLVTLFADVRDLASGLLHGLH